MKVEEILQFHVRKKAKKLQSILKPLLRYLEPLFNSDDQNSLQNNRDTCKLVCFNIIKIYDAYIAIKAKTQR